MSRPCTSCRHPDRVEIDSALASGASIRHVMARHSDLSMGAIARHARHLPGELAAAASAQRIATADSVLAELSELAATARAVLDRAVVSGRDGLALSAVRELRSTLLALGQVAAQVEARQRSGDRAGEEEIKLLAQGLRAVLPAHAAAARALAGWLVAADGGADLAAAVESLIPTTGLGWPPDSHGK